MMTLDEANTLIIKSSVRAGQIYRHYKGKLYSIVKIGLKEDTMEPMVVYRDERQVWIRSLTDFTQLVNTESGIVERFTRVYE